jgi:hypothetical protein
MAQAKGLAKPKARKVCGAKTSTGAPCKRTAGWGTDHTGFGKCKMHSGSTRNGKVAAAKEEAVELAGLLLGAAPDIAPHEAILLCLRSAVGEWRYWEMQIAKLTYDDLIVRPMSEAMGGQDADVRDLKNREEVHLYVQMRDKARASSARFSEMAARMGVEERQVQLAENFGDTISRLLDGILGDLHLTKAQSSTLPTIVSHHLQLVTVAESA